MNRTTLLVAVLVASTGLVVSTGAFPLSSDGTDRVSSVDIVMEPADGPNGQYAVINNETDEIALMLSGDNPDLEGDGIADGTITRLDNVFTITYTGNRSASVYVTDNAEDVSFYRGDDPSQSLEGQTNNVTLQPDDPISVGVLVDTRGDHDVESASGFTVHTNAVGDGGGGGGDESDGGDEGNSGGGDADVDEGDGGSSDEGDGGGGDGSDGDTVDTSSPVISVFSATNPAGRNVLITFDSSEPLTEIDVNLSGPENATLTGGDFEYDAPNGTYSATYDGNSDGTYTATLETAEDAAGNDGAAGQSDTVEVDVSSGDPVDTSPPIISDFNATNPAGQNVLITFNSSEPLATINATLRGTENATLTGGDFEYDAPSGTYSATYDGNSDGTYTVTLHTAEDAAGNDGATGQIDTVEVETDGATADSGDGSGGPPSEIGGFEPTTLLGLFLLLALLLIALAAYRRRRGA